MKTSTHWLIPYYISAAFCGWTAVYDPTGWCVAWAILTIGLAIGSTYWLERESKHADV